VYTQLIIPKRDVFRVT